MKLAFLLFAISAQAATYTASTVATNRCGPGSSPIPATGCNGRIQNADTLQGAWTANLGAAYSGGTSYSVGNLVTDGGLSYVCIQAGTGHTPASSPLYWLPTLTVNGSGKTGWFLMSGDDGNQYYDPTAPYGTTGSAGNNILLYVAPIFDVTGTSGTVWSQNIMTDFGTSPGDSTWAPAAPGTCTNGVTSTCNWKNTNPFCLQDSWCYLPVLRQTLSSVLGYDATLVATNNGGLTWHNAAGITSANGAAPTGPGGATYTAGILWPSSNPTTQYMARLECLQYGQGGVTWTSADNNATYTYCLTESGDFAHWGLIAFSNSSMNGLASTPTILYYHCPGYATSVCDGNDHSGGGPWSSTMSDQTNFLSGTFAYPGLGGWFYDPNLGIYVLTGGGIYGGSSSGPVSIQTAPKPWGPWTGVTSPPSNSPWTGAFLGFVTPIVPSVKTISSSVTEFSVTATDYTVPSGGGLALATYRLTVSGATGISVAGATATQATINYTPPSSSACTVDVSTDNFSTSVPDTDPLLFTNANSDARSGTLGSGGTGQRTFIAGTRAVQLDLNSANTSRALQANTLHQFKITCGGVATTGTFTTANPPINMSFQDGPTALDPTLSTSNRAQVIIDPHTGAKVNRVSLPGDVSNPGPFMYTAGFVPVCGLSLVGPTPGYLCSFPSGSGSVGTAMYYIDPVGETSVYLGYNAWGASSPNINPIDGKFYVMHNANDIVAYTYAGNYLTHSYSPATFTGPVTILANFPAAVQAFAPSFDPTSYPCGNPIADLGISAIGDYINLTCRISGGASSSYAWEIAVKISTGSVVAAVKTTTNIQSHWCGTHQIAALYNQPGMFINTHAMDGSDSGVGVGPYRTTYTGSNISPGVTSITVSGEPTCSGSCTPNPAQDPIAAVGDWYQWSDNSDPVQIVTKTSPTAWVITPTVASHSTSATLQAQCGNPAVGYPPIYWNYSVDPHGTDATNTYYVNNPHWFLGGHDLYDTNLAATENDGWVFRSGPLLANITGNLTNTVSSSPLFAGALDNCFGDGCKRHPSPAPGNTWITDYQGWDGSYYNTNDNFLTPIAGSATLSTSQLWKYTSGTYKTTQKYSSIVGSFGVPFTGGPYPFTNVSGPSCTIGATNSDSYKFGIVNASGECVSGSVKGEIYVNIKQTLCVDATGSTTAYTCPSPTNPPSAYSPSQIPFFIRFTPQTTNTTTSPTLAINGLAAKLIKDSTNSAPSIGSLVGGTMYLLLWDDGNGWFRVTTIVGCGANTTCIVNYNATSGSVLQISSTGTSVRAITQGLVQLRATNDYPTAKILPDASHILFTTGDADHTNLSQLLMAKLPPFVSTDAVDRTKFISYTVPITASGGSTRAWVKIGYAENGPVTSFYATQRQETTVVNTSTPPPTDGTTDPFKYLTTDSPNGLSCTSTCNIVLPLLPMHIMYYQYQLLDNSNTVLSSGPVSVIGDYSLPAPPATSSLGGKILGGKYAQGGAIR